MESLESPAPHAGARRSRVSLVSTDHRVYHNHWVIVIITRDSHGPGKSGEFIWSGKVREFCWWSRKMMCIVRDVYFCWKRRRKYTFNACYNKMLMESSRCRGLGSDWTLHKTSTCSSDGSGNNAEHSRGKSWNFSFEIWWEPCHCDYVVVFLARLHDV